MFEKGQEIIFDRRKAKVKNCRQADGMMMDGDGNISPVFKVTIIFKDTGRQRTFRVGAAKEVEK